MVRDRRRCKRIRCNGRRGTLRNGNELMLFGRAVEEVALTRWRRGRRRGRVFASATAKHLVKIRDGMDGTIDNDVADISGIHTKTPRSSGEHNISGRGSAIGTIVTSSVIAVFFQKSIIINISMITGESNGGEDGIVGNVAERSFQVSLVRKEDDSLARDRGGNDCGEKLKQRRWEERDLRNKRDGVAKFWSVRVATNGSDIIFRKLKSFEKSRNVSVTDRSSAESTRDGEMSKLLDSINVAWPPVAIIKSAVNFINNETTKEMTAK